MRILSVVGTRPQLIKAAALSPALRESHEEILVDTGQHYDDALAGDHLSGLGLAPPEHRLGIGSAPAPEQTARMLMAVADVVSAEHPDAVLVYGDTNSTLAGALAAAKLDLPVAHVEAGLRSHDRSMPEEMNRVLADHLSRWLFAPTPTAVENLRAEGIRAGVHLVGDVMQDLASRILGDVRDAVVLGEVGRSLEVASGPRPNLQPGAFLYATVHRAENRQLTALRAWVDILSAVADERRPVILALHPGTRAALDAAGISLPPDVVVVGPVGYRAGLALQLHSAAVITDSGGIQREAAWLRVPCLVLRSNTEWVEAVAGSDGRMVVVGRDRELAIRELARLAPIDDGGAAARTRASQAAIEPAGAAAAIAAALG